MKSPLSTPFGAIFQNEVQLNSKRVAPYALMILFAAYFKHFFFFVVITHFVLAAFYFTVGTLTRNSKIVYGLAACFYPIFIACGLLLLRGMPPRWKILLDPFLISAGPSNNGFGNS